MGNLSKILLVMLLSIRALYGQDSSNTTLIGRWVTGSCYVVAVENNYAYFCAGDELIIADISNPENPIRVGNIITGAEARGIFYRDGYLFIAMKWKGLGIIDVTDPTSPVEISYYNNDNYAKGVTVRGNYAYVVYGYDGLQIIDVSDPFNPVGAGTIDTDGDARGTAISGNYAFVADGINGVRIIDVGDPFNPVEVGHFDTDHNATGIDLNGNYAYVSDGWGGLRILDISDPTNPVETGNHAVDSWVYGVTLNFPYALIVDRGNLRVIDVSEPTSPVEIGFINTSDPVSSASRSVVVYEDHAYVADGDGGLFIINISEPPEPSLASHYNTWGSIDLQRVAVSNNHAYVADNENGLHIIDVTDLSNPLETGYYDVGINIGQIVSRDDYLYAACGDFVHETGRLSIINLSNPSFPVESGYLDLDRPAGKVTVRNNYAYVAAGALYIIDISDPAFPVEIVNYGNFVSIGGSVIDQNYAYILSSYYFAESTHTNLDIINIANPVNPLLAGTYSCPVGQSGNGLIIENNLAYIFGNNGVYTIDMSEIEYPVEIDFFPFSGSETIRQIASYDSYIYIAKGYDGLLILDSSAPGSLLEVGSYAAFSELIGVTANGSIVYLTFENSGLHIIQNDLLVGNDSDPPLPASFQLHQNYPNPFNPTTNITFELPEITDVTLTIYDIRGRQIRTLINGQKPAGAHAIEWNGINNTGIPVHSGVYFCRLQVVDPATGVIGNYNQTIKMIYLR